MFRQAPSFPYHELGIVEDGTTASRAISKDAFVIWNGSSYFASTDILQGATLEEDVNLTAIPDGVINGVISALNNMIDLYSTSEVACGTWIDGKTIYRRVYSFGALPNTTIKYLDSGLTDVATKIIKIWGMAYDRNNTFNVRPLPLADATTANCIRLDMIADGRISIGTGANWSSYDAYVFIEYIK